MRRRVSAIVALVVCALVSSGPAAAQDPTATTGLPTPAPTSTPAPTTTEAAPTTTEAAPPATAQTPAAPTTTTEAGAPAAASDDEDGPSPLLVGGIVLGVLALLVLLAIGLIRLTAWEPAWLPRARHALGEAAYRGGATWDEFRDWLRPRRAR